MVRTVSVEVPEPVIEFGAKAHDGGEVTTGTMLLQDRLNVPSKPFRGVILMVEVADPQPRRLQAKAPRLSS